MRNLTTFLAWFLFANCVQAAEDYYVWVDENGVTNFSQRDPKGVEARLISKSHRFGERISTEPEQRGSRPGAVQPESETTTATTSTTGGDIDPDSLIADQAAEIAAQIAKVKKDNCDIGKRNLAQLQAFSRIRVTGDDGQERVLSEQERDAQINEARQIIRENCSG